MRTFTNHDSSPATRAPSTRSGPERVVATFNDYASAEKAVDMLSDRGFPVERTAIVGRDLEYVEQVTGRMTTAKAALNGAAGGAVVGFFVGWVFGLFNWFNPVIAAAWLALWGVLVGAVLGAILGAIGHALLGGRRDFASVGAMRARRFDLVVDESVADEAARLLAGSPRT
jgi:heat induced stress protein YflT